ncbi:hypothetical protein KC19_12G073800 [Ceratodon purpureus]|uniref:Uncharacterized protein n=1 Tax=Ceratodon purpureus TaxID=3225 RepID=A0A8T0G871_CERPU|nr:hypothetical protein KC19_12G073800 [Ceratodon purpureus]
MVHNFTACIKRNDENMCKGCTHGLMNGSNGRTPHPFPMPHCRLSLYIQSSIRSLDTTLIQEAP